MRDRSIYARQLLDQYRRNPEQFTDKEAEKIARIARDYGLRFPRESKAFSKFAFDAVDTGLLGLLPNSMRPVSRGESTFGETKAERYAGSIGSLLGIAGTGGLAYAGRSAIARGGKAMLGKIPQASSKAGEYYGRTRSAIRNTKSNLESLDKGKFVGYYDSLIRRPFRSSARGAFREGRNL